MKTIQNFEEFSAAKESPVSLFLFKTNTCSVCAAVAPKIEDLMTGYPDIPSFSVWVESQPLIRGRMLVFSAPTVILFMKGTEIHRQSGFINFEKLKAQLENAIKK